MRYGLGPGGTCFCTECGYTEEHTLGTPCMMITCPQCGKTKLIRK